MVDRHILSKHTTKFLAHVLWENSRTSQPAFSSIRSMTDFRHVAKLIRSQLRHSSGIYRIPFLSSKQDRLSNVLPRFNCILDKTIHRPISTNYPKLILYYILYRKNEKSQHPSQKFITITTEHTLRSSLGTVKIRNRENAHLNDRREVFHLAKRGLTLPKVAFCQAMKKSASYQSAACALFISMFYVGLIFPA